MHPSTTAALLEKRPLPGIEPLGPVMGAGVTGVDVARPLTASVSAQLMRALRDYRLLCFRDQLLSTDALQDFASAWGTPARSTLADRAGDELPLVDIVSNADERGRPNGRPIDPAALRWRTDGASCAGAVATTLLYGVETPSRGGDMLFRDAAAGCAVLPEDFPRAVEPLSPARTHVALLELATQDRFVYRHAWRRHDLLVWDNRTFYRATPYDTSRDVLTTYCMVVASDRLQ